MDEVRLFSLDEMGCPDLKEYSYEFNSIGYCTIGKDYCLKKVKVTVVPEDVVPDVDDVQRVVRSWMESCIEEPTEARGQLMLDRLWNMFRPRWMRVELVPDKDVGYAKYGVVLERGRK